MTDRIQEHRRPSRPPDAPACHLAPPPALPPATLASHPALHPRLSGVSLAAAARSALPSIETLASAPLQLTPPFLVGVAAAAAVGIGIAVDGNLCLSAALAHDAPLGRGRRSGRCLVSRRQLHLDRRRRLRTPRLGTTRRFSSRHRSLAGSPQGPRRVWEGECAMDARCSTARKYARGAHSNLAKDGK